MLGIFKKQVCIFCNYKESHFLPWGQDAAILRETQVVGAGIRNNCACPQCNSTDRERLVYCYLREETLVRRKKMKILHIAPEKNLSAELNKLTNLDYVKGDFFAEGYEYSAEVQKINVEIMQFLDNEFDMIICNHVLEHATDDKKAMKELYRVLKPNGLAILQVPVSYLLLETLEDFTINTPEGRHMAFGQSDHVRLYSAIDYMGRLSVSGFSVELFFPKRRWKKFAINFQEKIFIARKFNEKN